MTVGRLKKILAHFNDDDRVIIDGFDSRTEATTENEVLYLGRAKKTTAYGFSKVCVIQTRKNIDIEGRIEAALEMYEMNGWDEVDALSELFDIGYTLDDFKYNDTRYEWAKNIAEEHGLV